MNTAKPVVGQSGAVSDAEASKDRLRLWLRILKVSKFIESELREKLRSEFDTTLPRFDVLAALYRNEDGLKMSDLSNELRVSNGNVTGIVDRLVADGEVVRVPVDNDRRAITVRLTPVGRARFETMAGDHEGWVDGLLSGLGGADARMLTAALDGIAPSGKAARRRGE